MPSVPKIISALYGTLTTSQIAKAAKNADTTPQMVEHVLYQLRRGCSPEHSHHPVNQD